MLCRGLCQPGFGSCMLVSGLRHAALVRLQVSYDLLDTYPGGPYKSRGGSIKKTRFAEEEEDEDDDDDEEDQVLACSALQPEPAAAMNCMQEAIASNIAVAWLPGPQQAGKQQLACTKPGSVKQLSP